MKKYFAKYLPVEGEINKGDKVLDTLNEQYDTWLDDDKCDEYGHYKKVKLFLCSRDIQVGDTVKCHSTKDEHKNGVYDCEVRVVDISEEHTVRVTMEGWEEDLPIPRNYLLKVIGEISPEATWVKEGDEFDETEIKIFRLPWDKVSVRILGPCKHFH